MSATNTPLRPGTMYHIYNRGNNRDPLFFEERNYRYFLKLYTKYIHPIADTYAYCLMPNHFHFLLRINVPATTRLGQSSATPPSSTPDDKPVKRQQPRTQKTGPISPPPADYRTGVAQGLTQPSKPASRYFNNMFIAYTKAINNAYDHTGSMFESPFRRKQVDNESYCITLIKYIHRNPQHHQIADFQDWPWSSYQAILSDAPTHIQRAWVLDMFGGRDGFVQGHQQDVSEDITIDWT